MQYFVHMHAFQTPIPTTALIRTVCHPVFVGIGAFEMTVFENALHHYSSPCVRHNIFCSFW